MVYSPGVISKPEYLSTRLEDKEDNEAAVIAYATRNMGPMERDAGDVQNRLQAIGYRTSRKAHDAKRAPSNGSYL